MAESLRVAGAAGGGEEFPAVFVSAPPPPGLDAATAALVPLVVPPAWTNFSRIDMPEEVAALEEEEETNVEGELSLVPPKWA